MTFYNLIELNKENKFKKKLKLNNKEVRIQKSKAYYKTKK